MDKLSLVRSSSSVHRMIHKADRVFIRACFVSNSVAWDETLEVFMWVWDEQTHTWCCCSHLKPQQPLSGYKTLTRRLRLRGWRRLPLAVSCPCSLLALTVGLTGRNKGMLISVQLNLYVLWSLHRWRLLQILLMWFELQWGPEKWGTQSSMINVLMMSDWGVV